MSVLIAHRRGAKDAEDLIFLRGRQSEKAQLCGQISANFETNSFKHISNMSPKAD